MVKAVSEQIRDCYRRAQDYAQKAAAETDLASRHDFLVMQRRLLMLAHRQEISGPRCNPAIRGCIAPERDKKFG